MKKYIVEIKEQAEKDLIRLLKNEPNAYKKALKLIGELYEHPMTGTEKPERLRGDRAGQWSRRITSKHRLIYEIHDMQVTVIVLTAYGHYDDI
ncbi:Txe/YoeB family addiction module toxin [Pseudoprevotella muciniphila]|uniref:Putative mRNA interferase YoeB n=1 Tax=Pseudoprevotella muciniphila TaxID=2133944 RepID=A0A5P8E6K3_9BACT|nr:Txe/YoeB family addiction module toxin [Pseudoprevotella muciniphila]QFQ12611.1 Txe/YoeB family addiction module toxin [Pseudoprevotella muciniphila]